MRRLCLLLLLMPLPARAQFEPRKTYGLVGSMLNLTDDPGIRAEIRATDEQVRALVAVRQKMWDNLYTLSPEVLRERIPKDRPSIEAEVGEILKTEQFARLRQLAVRESLDFDLAAERPPSKPFVFHGSEVSEILAELGVYLPRPRMGWGEVSVPAEQGEKLRTHMGPPYRGPVPLTRSPWGGDPRFSGDAPVPLELDILASPEVRQLLDAPTETGTRVAALIERWITETARLGVSTSFPSGRWSLDGTGGSQSRDDLSREQKKAMVDRLRAEVADEVTKLVGADRLRRARQIGNQLAARYEGRLGVYRLRHLDDELQLSAGQRFALNDALDSQHLRAIVARLRLDQPIGSPAKSLAEVETATAAKAEAILTAEQRAKWKELVGESIEGKLTFDLYRIPGRFDPEEARAFAAAAFGRYELDDLSNLRRPGFRSELNLNADRVEQVGEALWGIERQIFGMPGRDPRLVARVDLLVRVRLDAILTPEQRRRYEQLLIQERLGRAKVQAAQLFFEVPPVLASSLPGVAEKIALRDTQKKSLQEGQAESKVLSDEQMKKLTDLAGPPAKADLSPQPGGGRGFGPSGGFGLLPSPYHLLVNPFAGRGGGFGGDLEAAEELKLTAEQVGDLGKIAQQSQSESAEMIRIPAGERKATLEKAQAKAAAAIEKLLTPAQRKRLDQLALQVSASQSLGTALLGLADLKLTADQKQAIAKVREQARDRAKLLDDRVGGFPASMVVGRALREKLDAAILKALTAEQVASWNDRIGPAVEGLKPTPVPLGRFGFGGPSRFGREELP